jgi:DNA-binding helix-hairpin-helix protein with protein kinase domain
VIRLVIFSKGTKVELENGDIVEVKNKLGEGAQGIVYLVKYKDKDYALKWYLKPQAKEFIDNLRNNIIKGKPSEDYLWPLALTNQTEDGIGYLMDVRSKNFTSFVDFLNGRVVFDSLYSMLTWSINLADSFKKLHTSGYSYQDVNEGAFFLDVYDGKILICDNDNVTANTKNLGILGKPKYMAPEVIRQEKIPDIHSDRYSMAVIFFNTLVMSHPFQGDLIKNYPIIDETAERELYATNPVFIFNKKDRRNAPIRGYHTTALKRWPLLPDYVQEAFHKTFTLGLNDRENGRTTELEWIKILARYRDELVKCSSCSFQFASLVYSGNQEVVCTSCKTTNERRIVLEVNNNLVLLDLKKYIYETHYDKYSGKYAQVVGEIVSNKLNPKLWGIKNLSGTDWSITDDAGVRKIIPHQGVVPIIKNLQIEFKPQIIGKLK